MDGIAAEDVVIVFEAWAIAEAVGAGEIGRPLRASMLEIASISGLEGTFRAGGVDTGPDPELFALWTGAEGVTSVGCCDDPFEGDVVEIPGDSWKVSRSTRRCAF